MSPHPATASAATASHVRAPPRHPDALARAVSSRRYERIFFMGLFLWLKRGGALRTRARMGDASSPAHRAAPDHPSRARLRRVVAPKGDYLGSARFTAAIG